MFAMKSHHRTLLTVTDFHRKPLNTALISVLESEYPPSEQTTTATDGFYHFAPKYGYKGIDALASTIAH